MSATSKHHQRTLKGTLWTLVVTLLTGFAVILLILPLLLVGWGWSLVIAACGDAGMSLWTIGLRSSNRHHGKGGSMATIGILSLVVAFVLTIFRLMTDDSEIIGAFGWQYVVGWIVTLVAFGISTHHS